MFSLIILIISEISHFFREIFKIPTLLRKYTSSYDYQEMNSNFCMKNSNNGKIQTEFLTLAYNS